MKKSQLRPLWLRKRVVFPGAFIIGILVAAVIAMIRSDASTIVVYNETGAPLPPLLIQACNQTKTFTHLDDQQSVRWRLKPEGLPGPIHLEVAATPLWVWDGDTIQPQGGYRVTIRLQTGNQVESYIDYSWWRRAFSY
jgi:hypothetical protein